MQTEAEELDKMMAELAARKAELAKASATAKAACPPHLQCRRFPSTRTRRPSPTTTGPWC